MEKGAFKKIGDQFKRNPKLLCENVTQCLETVKDGQNAAFCDVGNFLMFLCDILIPMFNYVFFT